MKGERIPDNPFASGLILGNLGAPLRTYHDLDDEDHDLVEDGCSCIEEIDAIQREGESCMISSSNDSVNV